MKTRVIGDIGGQVVRRLERQSQDDAELREKLARIKANVQSTELTPITDDPNKLHLMDSDNGIARRK